ncbi:hypothetical protein R3I94_015622 [Phoxinus phoxinus]
MVTEYKQVNGVKSNKHLIFQLWVKTLITLFPPSEMGHADFSVRERAIESPAAITQKHLHKRAAAATVFIFWQTGWQTNQPMYMGNSEIEEWNRRHRHVDNFAFDRQ